MIPKTHTLPTQGRLDNFFKVLPTTSTSNKRKSNADTDKKEQQTKRGNTFVSNADSTNNCRRLITWLLDWHKHNDKTTKGCSPMKGILNPWSQKGSGSAFKAALLSNLPDSSRFDSFKYF